VNWTSRHCIETHILNHTFCGLLTCYEHEHATVAVHLLMWFRLRGAQSTLLSTDLNLHVRNFSAWHQQCSVNIPPSFTVPFFRRNVGSVMQYACAMVSDRTPTVYSLSITSWRVQEVHMKFAKFSRPQISYLGIAGNCNIISNSV
jgi:hypothetical protein